MNTTINQMPADAKVWVYQSSKPLSEEQIVIITKLGNDFIDGWAAHGAALKASFDIIRKQFIVIAVDQKQAMASGCSIDKSVAFMKEIDQQFNLHLFDRLQVAYSNDKDITVCSLSEFEKLANTGIITADTLVFNNMISTKAEFDTQWEIPIKQSWHSRVLSN